jgi:hypothetical protein
VNGATLTADRFGNVGKAYSFDGVNDFIEILNSVSLNSATQSISISIWFNINNWYSANNSGWFPIMSKSNLAASYGNYRNGLTINSSGIKGFYGTLNSDITGEDTLNFQLNNWNQIVYTINDANNSGSVYLNGILLIQGLTSYTGWSTTNTLPLIFGMDKPGIVDYANGKLDDIGIWNRALTQCEIQDLYNSQLGSANTSSTLTQTALDSLTLNGQTYTQSGTYTQVIPNAAGCDSTITLNLSLSYTGITELKDGIHIYPNPTFDNLTIERTSSLNSEYVLVDSQGRLVLQGELTETITHLSLGKLEYGNYILQLENQSVPIRIMKQ